jgi:tRNA-dihydrouridine synthase C
LALKVIAGGASELAIHARTKEDRYKPPAYWNKVKSIADRSTIPVIINGEIWNPEQAGTALGESGCNDLMLGRGALACLDLAANIQAQQNGQAYTAMTWPEVLTVVVGYLRSTENRHPMFVSNRGKQWLVFLQMHYPEAKAVFHQVKRLKRAADVFAVLETNLAASLTLTQSPSLIKLSTKAY